MPKKDCQESVRIYKAFLKRMEHVNQFIKVAEVCLPFKDVLMRILLLCLLNRDLWLVELT